MFSFIFNIKEPHLAPGREIYSLQEVLLHSFLDYGLIPFLQQQLEALNISEGSVFAFSRGAKPKEYFGTTPGEPIRNDKTQTRPEQTGQNLEKIH